jgi:hypothetical protein
MENEKTFEQVVKENPNFEWKDISERVRTYIFQSPNGYMNKVVIRKPVALHVSKSGGHRIVDAYGDGWYILPKWITIHWEVVSGTESYRF